MLNCSFHFLEYESTFRNKLVQSEGKKPEEETRSGKFQLSAVDNYNHKLPYSSYSNAKYIQKWTEFSRKQNKYNDSKIRQYLHFTDTKNKSIKLLSLSRIKRSCTISKFTLSGRRKRMFDEACIKEPGIPIDGGGGGGGSATGVQSTATTTRAASSPLTSKQLTTTIKSSLLSLQDTSSNLPSTKDHIPLVTNEPIHTESFITDLDTTKNTDQLTTLTMIQLGISTYLPMTTVATTTSIASASTRFVSFKPSEIKTTPMQIQQQTFASTRNATFFTNTHISSLNSSITPSSTNITNLKAAQSTTLKIKSTAPTINSLLAKQDTTYPKPTSNFRRIKVTTENTNASSSQTLVTTRVSSKTMVSVLPTSPTFLPSTSVSQITTLTIYNERMLTTLPSTTSVLVTTAASPVKSSLKSVSTGTFATHFGSFLVSLYTVVDVSYLVHQTFSTESIVAYTPVDFMSVSTTEASYKQERLTTTFAPVHISFSTIATPPLQTPHKESAKTTTINDFQTLFPTTAQGLTNSISRKNSKPDSNSKMFSIVESFHSERVAISTALPTHFDISIRGTLVSVDAETQATSTALSISASDKASTGIFETASNVAIVSTVVTSVALLTAVLLIYSYMSQTGCTGQLYNR